MGTAEQRTVSFESDGKHWAATAHATTENSAILRTIERRKVERAAMRIALAQSLEFAALVESLLLHPADPKAGEKQRPNESYVLARMHALRAEISKVTA